MRFEATIEECIVSHGEIPKEIAGGLYRTGPTWKRPTKQGNHVRLGIKLAPNMIHYGRHYLRPIPDVLDGTVREPEYDVVTEVRFESREAFEENSRLMQSPQALAELIADEEFLFDRSKKSRVIVEDHVPDLSGRGER